MASAESSSRKRKACLQCIRAKAKCSTSEERSDECHRCMRLNKVCVFEVAAKKPGPGPKSRSRVRQLEQRVESLIDLIATQKSANGGTDATDSQRAPRPTQVMTPDSSAVSDAPADTPTPGPAARFSIEPAPFKVYDPVEAGVIEEQHAYRLVEEFKNSFAPVFPFVIVETDAATLRHQQPFLFHAVVMVTAYESPPLQHLLGDEMKRQLGRIVEYSRKSLEILQGLLIYLAWYHTFYQPVHQQIAVIVQICVALVQDLGLTRHLTSEKQAPVRWSVADCVMVGRARGTLAEKRAYLGAFYLAVLFAQAWRKRTTLFYTRYMAQCTDAFSDSAVPTDLLIKPLIQSSELLVRINDHFSYDDISNSELRGEMMLDMTVTNFLGELKRIRDAAESHPSLKQNTSLSLVFCLTEMSINEVCLHSALWGSTGHGATSTLSLIRLKMLNRTMVAGTDFMTQVLNTPKSLLFRFGLSTWAGWFYAVILLCKLVFFTENESIGQTGLDNIPEELDNLIPQNIDQVIASSTAVKYHEHSAEIGWDPLTVAQEFNIQALFEQFMAKLRFTLPVGVVPWSIPKEQRDSLHSIACIQQTMLHGFSKRLNQIASGQGMNTGDAGSSGQLHAGDSGQPYQNMVNTTWQNPQINSDGSIAAAHATIPFANFMNFDSINFDGIVLPGTLAQPPQVGQEILGDWMWDMVMDDFTMPAL